MILAHDVNAPGKKKIEKKMVSCPFSPPIFEIWLPPTHPPPNFLCRRRSTYYKWAHTNFKGRFRVVPPLASVCMYACIIRIYKRIYIRIYVCMIYIHMVHTYICTHTHTHKNRAWVLGYLPYHWMGRRQSVCGEKDQMFWTGGTWVSPFLFLKRTVK